MADLAYRAMMFAREVHAGQVRKYTGNPYADHLAEVAGIVSTVAAKAHEALTIDEVVAVAWLHDSFEDQGMTPGELDARFGRIVAVGVAWLSDIETGNRAERKAASRARLARAPGWIQTIKCADLISNTSSIVKHDPKFAVTYLAEKRALLDVMNKADPRLREFCELLRVHALRLQQGKVALLLKHLGADGRDFTFASACAGFLVVAVPDGSQTLFNLFLLDASRRALLSGLG